MTATAAKVRAVARDAHNAKATEGDFWRAGLLKKTTRGGKLVPRAIVANVMHVFEHHPEWTGVLGFCEFREAPVTLKPPPCREADRPSAYTIGEWTDEDTIRTVAWLSAEAFDVGREIVDQAVLAVARKRGVHPVRDYLRTVTWDRVDRLSTWIPKYLGAVETAYTRAIGRAWLVSAVARVMKPGCQADHLLVLEGPQGKGKSSALRVLGGEWLNESPIEITDSREAGQALRAVMIVVFDELDGLHKGDARRVKAFLTLTTDTYRASYARRTRSYPRQCVFAATTNESGYLSDSTGNRRFWPVTVGSIDLSKMRADRDQLWAEAFAAFEAGEPWHLTDKSLESAASDEQRAREADDPWTAKIGAWMIAKAALYPHGATTAEVLQGALCLVEPKDLSRANATRAGEVLRRLGYLPSQHREGRARVRRYAPAQPTTSGSDEGSDTDAGTNQPQSQVTTRHNPYTGVGGSPEHYEEPVGNHDVACDGSDVVTEEHAFSDLIGGVE